MGTHAFGVYISLCISAVLCASVVELHREKDHHRDTENFTGTQRRSDYMYSSKELSLLLCLSCIFAPLRQRTSFDRGGSRKDANAQRNAKANRGTTEKLL